MMHPLTRTVQMINLIYSEERVGDGSEKFPFGLKVELHTPSGKCVASKMMPWEGKNLIEFYPKYIDESTGLKMKIGRP